MTGLGRQVRAVFITVALLGHGIYALPLPPRVSPTEMKKVGQGEIEGYVALLNGVGIPATAESLGDFVISATSTTSTLHAWLKAPFRPLFDLVGANQSWALFAATTTTPERLVVEVQDRGSREWRTILRRLDPCCTWREDQIRYRRIRGVWDSQYDGMRPAYLGLSKWLATRAFEDFPDANKVRVRIERGRATYPWEPVDPKTTFIHDRVHVRSDTVKPGPG